MNPNKRTYFLFNNTSYGLDVIKLCRKSIELDGSFGPSGHSNYVID